MIHAVPGIPGPSIAGVMLELSNGRWLRHVAPFVAWVVALELPPLEASDLFLQPGTTLSGVVIPRYSDTLESIGILRVVTIRVAEDGTVLAEKLSAELSDENGRPFFLRAGSAVLERGFDGISTSDGTELRMNGIQLKTGGLIGNLKALDFVSKGGFRLDCEAGHPTAAPLEAAGPLGPGPRRPELSWGRGGIDLGRGRGPIVEPRGPNDPFWFGGSFEHCLEFHSSRDGRLASGQDLVRLLSKGPGRFQVKSGTYSSSGGVLVRLPLGLIACGDRFDVTWGSPVPVSRKRGSKVMPADVRRLHAAGGCHIRIASRKGKTHVVVCDEVRYSGKTGLISLQGGYPRIDSAEGRLVASSKNQYLRINSEGRLILGPGHWQSDHSLQPAR